MVRRRSRSPYLASSTSRTPSSPSLSPSPSLSRSRSPYSPAQPSPEGMRKRRRSSRRVVELDNGDGYDYGDREEEEEEEEERGFRVHVGSLATSTTSRQLKRQFGRFGEILDLWMARTQPCFAFVVFRHREDASRAIDSMDGATLHSRRMRVTMARPRTKGTRSGGNFNPYLRCYQCGKMGHFSRVCRAHQWGSARPDERARREPLDRQEPRYDDFGDSRQTKQRSGSGDVTYRRC